jgi:hypothetical protein
MYYVRLAVGRSSCVDDVCVMNDEWHAVEKLFVDPRNPVPAWPTRSPAGWAILHSHMVAHAF